MGGGLKKPSFCPWGVSRVAAGWWDVPSSKSTETRCPISAHRGQNPELEVGSSFFPSAFPSAEGAATCTAPTELQDYI